MNLHELMQKAESRRLSNNDMESFCANSPQPWKTTLDNCALELAKAYAAGNIGFAAGDNLANALFGFAVEHGEIPDLMFSVFLAFDAGEFYPDEIRTPTPEERFTRPQINEILKRHAA